jgi:hypothetical protein
MFGAHLDFGPHALGQHLGNPDPPSRLTDARDACSLYDARFILPRREASRLVDIYVHARKLLAVSILNSHAPMMVLATAILAELCWLSFGHDHRPLAALGWMLRSPGRIPQASRRWANKNGCAFAGRRGAGNHIASSGMLFIEWLS